MTQAAPVQHGQQSLTDKICHAEQVIDLSGYTNQISSGGYIDFFMGAAVMPWDGQLTAHVVHFGSFPPGLVGVSLGLSTSSPVPPVSYVGAGTNFTATGTGYEFVSGMAQWRDLAKAQTVNVYARVSVPLSNVNWTCMSFFGWLRMARI